MRLEELNTTQKDKVRIMPITFVQRGNFHKANRYMELLNSAFKNSKLDKYGKEGVAALSAATPVDTGKTASSWDYYIERTPLGISINWINTNMKDGYSVALLVQYGHIVWNGRSGASYKEGVDYINPAIQPIMDRAVKEIGEGVT